MNTAVRTANENFDLIIVPGLTEPQRRYRRWIYDQVLGDLTRKNFLVHAAWLFFTRFRHIGELGRKNYSKENR